MLKIMKHMGQISFSSLMAVYEETNREIGQEEWPDLPEHFAIQMAENDAHQYLREIFFKTPGAVYAIYTVEENYVSALRLEPYRDGLLIEALETAPGQRRKGYGRALIRAVQEVYSGRTLYSHIDKQNAASRELHQSCGFEKVEDFVVYIDGSVNYRGSTYCYRGKNI